MINMASICQDICENMKFKPMQATPQDHGGYTAWLSNRTVDHRNKMLGRNRPVVLRNAATSNESDQWV